MGEAGNVAIAIGEPDIEEDLRRFERVPAPGPYVVISVEDSGGPLAHDAQMALFESFRPVKDMPGETGAILSRSYEYVRHWGGDISVASTPSGTRFSIFLPHAGRKLILEAPAAELPAAVEPPAPAVAAPPVVETILVVEDEGGIRPRGRKILQRQGETARQRANGAD